MAKSKDRLSHTASEAGDQRPKIVLRKGRSHEAVDRAEEVLLERCVQLGLFQRAGEVVRIVSVPDGRAGGGLNRPKCTILLENVTNTALTETLNQIANWRRRKKPHRTSRIDCPPRIATAYLSRRRWRLPVLTGIISAPIVRNDGSVLQEPGYDAATHLYLVSNEKAARIPERPTLRDAKLALETLLFPFAQFPFISEPDKAVHLACILSAIQRPFLQACPIFGYSAPAQRSGKSLLAESVAIIATGKPAPATAVSGDREEMRKMITSALREGHSVINLDNVEHPLASPDLAKAVTQSEYQDRALGSNKMLTFPTTMLWTVTGNNLTFRRDLSSRALLCRIDAKVESPEARKFQIPNLKRYLERNRESLIAAALMILRAYHVAGCPQQNVRPWGGFEDWSASIREPLIWLGLTDPCETRYAVVADDPERQDSLALLRALHEEFKDSEFTAKRINSHCRTSRLLKTALESVAVGRAGEIDVRLLGWWLRKTRDRIIGGLRLEMSGKESGSNRWKIVELGGQKGHEGHFQGPRRFPRLKPGTIWRFPRFKDKAS